MEFSFYIRSMLELLAYLVVLYGLGRIIMSNYSGKTKKMGASASVPEPSGAWPLIGHFHLLRDQKPVCKILGAMADKYGPVYSLKLGHHPTLIASSWEIVKDCLSTNDRILATRPSIAAGKYLGYDNAFFPLAPYGEYWRDIRKLATIELLSTQMLEKLKDVRASEVDAFVTYLNLLCVDDRYNPTKVTIGKLIENLTFNINLKMIVGKRFPEKDYADPSSEVHGIKEAIEEAVYLSGVFVLEDAIPWLQWLDFKGHVGSMKKTAKKINLVIGKWLEEHAQKKLEDHGNSNDAPDFMDVMLSKVADGDLVMSTHTREAVIKATTLTLIFTGAESTSIAITWAISLLLNHPKVLNTAQEELDMIVGRNKWVEESDIKKLRYLQAIVKETLRLYSPGPVTGLREAMEDCEIGGYCVPKGTRLIVNLWKLHRDPRIWHDPCEFLPERFMTTHAPDQHFKYIPFSFGRRSCPGMNLGLSVVQLVLARIIQGFNLATIGGKPIDMQEGLGIALPKLNPLEVLLTPRLCSDLYRQ